MEDQEERHPADAVPPPGALRHLGLEVFAGPFVRSSYRAEEAFLRVINR